jgi:O-antigen/teichoic acid export membrane protein
MTGIVATIRTRAALGGVARSFVVVGAATAIGQGALVIAAPVLARLYDPAAFGAFSVYAALLSVFVAGAALRYDLAIPLATDASEAVHLLALSTAVAVVVSAGLALLVGLAGTQIVTALGAAPLGPFVMLLPASLFVASTAQAIGSWGVFHRSFGGLGRMRALQGVAQAVCQTVFGLLHAGAGGLILGDVTGRLVGIEQLARPLVRTLRTTSVTFTGIRRCARERWGFGRVMTTASLLNALSMQLPFLVLPAMFDLASSGQYFLAYRLLVLPASLVAAAVSQVFYGEASHRRDDPRRLHDLALNVSVSLFVFSIPTYLTVMIAGPALIEMVFGPTWDLAGTCARIIAPGLIFWSVASPISSLPLVGRRERESLVFTGAELCLKAGALGVGAATGSLVVGLIVLTLATVGINIAALWRFLRVATVSLRDLVRPTTRILLLSLPSLAALVVTQAVLPRAVLPVAIVGWLAAVGLCVRFSPEARALLSGSHD